MYVSKHAAWRFGQRVKLLPLKSIGDLTYQQLCEFREELRVIWARAVELPRVEAQLILKRRRAVVRSHDGAEATVRYDPDCNLVLIAYPKDLATVYVRNDLVRLTGRPSPRAAEPKPNQRKRLPRASRHG